MTAVQELIAKGARYPLSGVIKQARIQAGLAEAHPEVKQFGWTDAKSQALRAGADELDTKETAAVEAKDAAKEATRKEVRLVTEGKALVRSVRNVARVVARNAQAAGVSADAQRFLGGAIDQSTTKLKEWLKDVGPELERLAPHFAPYVKGSKPVHERAKELDAALSRADVAQELSYAALPTGTAALYEKKGRLVELIEELNAVAKNAFDGNAEVIGKFNKDQLLRARRATPEEQPK